MATKEVSTTAVKEVKTTPQKPAKEYSAKLSNKDIYEIADRLGMIDEQTDLYTVLDRNELPKSEYFATVTSKDLVGVMNFVDQLLSYNDLATVAKLLTAIIYTNK